MEVQAPSACTEARRYDTLTVFFIFVIGLPWGEAFKKKTPPRTLT
jgi:hypothetical protein